MEAVFTMWPPPLAMINGVKVRTPWITPHRSTSMIHRQVSRSISHDRPPPDTPALLHATCTAPNTSIAAAPSRSTSAGFETSAVTANTSAPAERSSWATVSSVSVSTSASTTFMPCCANAVASARPIPLAAPVTTATLPANSST